MCGECSWPMDTKDKSLTKITLKNGFEMEVKGISEKRFKEIQDLIDSNSEEFLGLSDVFDFPARAIVKMKRV